MKHQRCIPLESRAEWEKALEGINHTFAHTWGYCYAMYLTSGLNTYLYCFESDKTQVICPIEECQFNGYIDIKKPYGFSGFVGTGDCQEFQKHWREFALQKGYVSGYLGLNPIFDYGDNFNQEEVFQHDTVYLLDLTLAERVLLSNIHKRKRSRLRRTENVNLVHDRPALSEFFVKNYTEFLQSKGADSFYFFSEKSLRFLLNLENTVIVGAQISGKIVAVELIAFTNNVADALFMINLPEGRHYSTELIWYGMTYLKSRKVEIFNLGGGSGGVATYKKELGAKPAPLRHLRQVYDLPVYRNLCQETNADPANMGGYFPPYRKPL